MNRILSFILIFFVCFCTASSAQATSLPLHNILVLHSFHSGMAWTESINLGIEEVLLAKDRQDIELHIEYIDGLRQPGGHSFQRLAKFLGEKYQGMTFDAVIVVDIVAYHFMEQYHTDLFAMTPVLYTAVNCADINQVEQNVPFAGVCENVDVDATINAGLHLYPDTQKIVIINDRTEDGLTYDRIIQQSVEFFDQRVDIEIWDDVTIEDLMQKVQDLQDGTLLLLMQFTQDRAGRTFSYERSLGLINRKCKVPILSMWQFYLGNGVMGGMMVDGQAQGRAVAKLVIDILVGEQVENLFAVKSTTNQLIFDYTRMKRFDISYKALPEGSIVTKEPQSVLWKYKKIGWTVLALALVLEATVIILSVVTYKSKKAEQKLEELVNQRTHELTTANEQLLDENIERKKVEEALRESEETLHQLSVNLLTVQENERRRISFELHDELGQSLAALKMQIGSLKMQLSREQPALLFQGCDGLRESINLIIENVRRLSRDLSPVALDDLGIDVALEYLITNFSKLHNIKIDHELVDITHLFCQDAQRHIYRIVQESLNNIGKHAHADHVAIKIEKKKNRIFLIVKDNGNGFNSDEIQKRKTPESGMGLTAMSERVRILEGELDITSVVGLGTTVTVSMPV